jgi:hypothetical protein
LYGLSAALAQTAPLAPAAAASTVAMPAAVRNNPRRMRARAALAGRTLPKRRIQGCVDS